MAGLYFHIPFCEHKCIYCDFYSVENRDSQRMFLNALEKEIAMRAERFDHTQSVETIFFGGGTPSLLTRAEFERIFSVIRDRFRITDDAEITIESNPGTVERGKLADFRAVGFNRISFGIQSFHNDDLKFLTRIHSAEDAERAVGDAMEAGFANVSLDLIFALPGQTQERWRENLRRAVALRPQHISAYALIVEDQTPLASMVKEKLVAPLPDEEDAELYRITLETMAAHGYAQYEVSNFAQPGLHSRHNLNYWNHADYIGFGPSAHSFVKDSSATGKRWWNVRSIRSYCDALEDGKYPESGSEFVDRRTFLTEEIFLGLRSTGIDLAKLYRIYGEEVFTLRRDRIAGMVAEGLMTDSGNRLTLTPRGFAICDEIAAQLIL